MNLNFFLRGLVLGFSIAAPVGPIGVLCIRRTLADGRAVGLASGLGAATADALYGAIAGLGLTALSGLLLAQRDWLSLVGGCSWVTWVGVPGARCRRRWILPRPRPGRAWELPLLPLFYSP